MASVDHNGHPEARHADAATTCFVSGNAVEQEQAEAPAGGHLVPAEDPLVAACERVADDHVREPELPVPTKIPPVEEEEAPAAVAELPVEVREEVE